MNSVSSRTLKELLRIRHIAHSLGGGGKDLKLVFGGFGGLGMLTWNAGQRAENELGGNEPYNWAL